jgi:hypothetical protein
MAEDSESGIPDKLARMERELEHLSGGLGLLGIKPCTWCRKFFRFSDPGALFECDQLVCYGCLHDWWLHRSPELGVKDRQAIEHKLMRWLVSHHDATVTPQTKSLPEPEPHELRIVAACQECDATGTQGGSRCHFCGGAGTLWVVVRNRNAI